MPISPNENSPVSVFGAFARDGRRLMDRGRLQEAGDDDRGVAFRP